jgi:hypothetical protein
MHLTHQYNAAYFSGWVKNRCTYHTNTTPLTFLAWKRIDARYIGVLGASVLYQARKVSGVVLVC